MQVCCKKLLSIRFWRTLVKSPGRKSVGKNPGFTSPTTWAEGFLNLTEPHFIWKRPRTLASTSVCLIIHGKNSKELYNYLLERMDAKLAGWKGRSLSQVGRVSLAQSVLNSLLTYVMQRRYSLSKYVINWIRKFETLFGVLTTVNGSCTLLTGKRFVEKIKVVWVSKAPGRLTTPC
ncbi:hypothetical protein LINPERHAP1_LOCUS40956 [Linum perenne]